MKRSLVLSVCAAALAACFINSAQAAIDVQLNLRYTDPNNEAAGGTWDLLVKSNVSGEGIAGVVVALDNATVIDAAGTTGFDEFQSQTVGTKVEIVTGFGAGLAGAATDVGLGAGTTGATADDLFGNASATWADSALIAHGTFGATRPSFTTIPELNTGGITEGNVYVGSVVTARAAGTTSVRGDGVNEDTLIIGDLNRDGQVAGADLLALLPNLGTAGGWDDGDFGSDGQVAGSDLLALLPNLGQVSGNPAFAAVPEPSSIAMLALAGLSFGLIRRK